ncbi:MAG: (2Fe-2S) ferredoxin domain-containing protein [Salinivirgaceae bacterium]
MKKIAKFEYLFNNTKAMGEKTEIIICLGSSCFARGNKKTVQAIESYLNEHNLKDRVYFHGGHCFGNCDRGPILKVNDRFYERVDSFNVIDILAKELDD